jgi:hypothetical protein
MMILYWLFGILPLAPDSGFAGGSTRGTAGLTNVTVNGFEME